MTTTVANTPDDAPEFGVQVVGTLTWYFEHTYGADRLAALWQREGLSLPLSYMKNSRNFVSIEFTERLVELLTAESGDEKFVEKASACVARPEVLGATYYFLRAFSTPRALMQKSVEVQSTFCRVGHYEVLESSSNSMVLAYKRQKPERTRLLCRGRVAQWACVPTIWGLPPATVTETECTSNGADACVFKMNWQNPLPFAWRRYVGVVAGAVLGVSLRAALQTGPLIAVFVLGVIGFLAGGWLDVLKILGVRDQQLREQNDGLLGSMDELAHRYEELYRTKNELEVRVAERTHEISEAKEKLQLALERQTELDRLKTKFFDNVSHELRTPLTLILLTLESLQQTAEQLPPAIRQHLDRMEKSSSRLLKLINDLLDLAKLEAGKMRLRYDPVDLKQLLTGVIIPFRVLADGKGLSLRLEVAENVAAVFADPEKLDLVFQNLVSNALKFTQSGEVVVTVNQDERYAHVSVQDTGSGIASSDLPIIFDRFSQADSSGTRRFGGTGIGLALVKETVELHGGLVSVTSELGRGSRFRVSLPRGTAHIREELRERRRNDVPVRHERRLEHLAVFGRRDFWSGKAPPAAASQMSAEAKSTEPVEVNRPTVLIVEDDEEIRGFLRGFLGHSYELVEANDGQQGLQLALEKRPALIVSDVMMPVMSGLQMLDQLRSLPETVDIPVILLTARSDVAARVHGIGAGASDYIGKPFAPKELVARIEAQLRLREAAARLAQAERLAAVSLLTSGFAHEVRNPLNGLLNALAPLRECLTLSPDPELALSMIGAAEESAARIRHLAESLLSLVRSTATHVPVSLKHSLDGATRALQWKLPPDVTVEVMAEADEHVFGDPATLTQVWVNLIDNAVRAVSSGGHISVRITRDGKDVVTAVRDDGCGVAPENTDRLFEPFFSTRPAGQGTGLGLALSRRIVVAHGGRIRIDSEPGQGTVVTVRLPAHDPTNVEETVSMKRDVA